MAIKMPTIHDRYVGTLLGVHAGDSLGAPYETWDAKSIEKDLAERGGLVPFDYPDPWKHDSHFERGRPTDDSDHTAAFAESLIANLGLNPEDLYLRLRTVVFEHKSPLWDGKAVGAGKTTRKMLRPQTYEESLQIPSNDAFPSNGSLMRASPFALFFGRPDRFHEQNVRYASFITHRHDTAAECCVAYTAILTGLLAGMNPTWSLGYAHLFGKSFKDQELKKVLWDPTKKPRDPNEWPGRGAAVLTLHVALFVLLTSRSFEDGVTKAVMFGGDTDTYAAVAGGLLGARFGVDDIPSLWLGVLKGKEKMKKLGRDLLALNA